MGSLKFLCTRVFLFLAEVEKLWGKFVLLKKVLCTRFFLFRPGYFFFQEIFVYQSFSLSGWSWKTLGQIFFPRKSFVYQVFSLSKILCTRFFLFWPGYFFSKKFLCTRVFLFVAEVEKLWGKSFCQKKFCVQCFSIYLIFSRKFFVWIKITFGFCILAQSANSDGNILVAIISFW